MANKQSSLTNAAAACAPTSTKYISYTAMTTPAAHGHDYTRRKCTAVHVRTQPYMHAHSVCRVRMACFTATRKPLMGGPCLGGHHRVTTSWEALAWVATVRQTSFPHLLILHFIVMILLFVSICIILLL